ncbi:MAG: HIT family protein [Candidatus Paceibacterota bacterium]
MNTTDKEKKEDCIFCKIIAGEVPSHTIWENEEHLAFLSIFPNTPGFTVVTTKEHLPSYAFENDDEVLTKLILATKKVARLLDKSFEDVGRTGMFFEGYGVDHLHSKLFPMHGTADLAEWKNIESKGKNEFYEKYPGYLSSHDAERVDDEELKALAEKIRNMS